MAPEKEILKFDDLKPHLFLKNGNYLYKIPFRGGWAILKVYYGDRGTLEELRRSFGNVVLHGQTSYLPKTRCRIERECMELWKKHGFRVFGRYDDVEVVAPGCRPGGYAVMEYVEATKLVDILKDRETSVEQKMPAYRGFLKDWSRRHDIAIAEREPKLVHENGDAKHVMILEDGYLWFDFEMSYRFRSRVKDYVSHEIVQNIWYMTKTLHPDEQDRFLDETIEGYPVRERLQRAYDYLFRHPNPFWRAGRALHRVVRRSSRKPTSKYNVMRRFHERLKAK
jgi:hypothetical protein